MPFAVDAFLALCVILLLGGLWQQDLEWTTEALAGLVLAVVWKVAHSRRLTGADVAKRLRLSRRTLQILGGVLVAFAMATAWGVYRGFIPSGLVAVMLAFVAAAPILAAPFLFFHRWASVRSEAAEAWPQAAGRVENSFMEEAVSPWPAPIVHYSYRVDERPYRGHRVRFGGTAAMNPIAAEEILAAFPTGADIAVFYNPKKPRQSVLLPAQRGANKSLLWGAGVLAAVPLAGAIFIALFILLGFIDAALTAIVGHRVLP